MSKTQRAVSPNLDEASVIYEQEDGVVTLTLNRPRQLNALNSALARQLAECVQRAETEADTRVIVIKGAGSHFMAGGDVQEFRLASLASVSVCLPLATSRFVRTTHSLSWLAARSGRVPTAQQRMQCRGGLDTSKRWN